MSVPHDAHFLRLVGGARCTQRLLKFSAMLRPRTAKMVYHVEDEEQRAYEEDGCAKRVGARVVFFLPCVRTEQAKLISARWPRILLRPRVSIIEGIKKYVRKSALFYTLLMTQPTGTKRPPAYDYLHFRVEASSTRGGVSKQ